MCRLMIFLAISLMMSSSLQAQDPVSTDQSQVDRDENARDRLGDLQKMITSKTLEKTELEAKILGEPEDEALQQQMVDLTKQLEGLDENFETIATGGPNIEGFYSREKVELDWKNDLMEIASPLLDNLKELSKRPREIEKYRSDLDRYSARKIVAQEAIANIERLKGVEALEPEAVEHLQQLEKDWRRHNEDVARDLEVTQFKLNELLKSDGSMVDMLSQGIGSFFKGRGLNLLLALLSAGLMLALMRWLIAIFVRTTHNDEARRQQVSIRIILYSMHLMTGVLVVGTALITLYLLGDWILMGIMLIILIGTAIRLKDWIPRFISEMRLLLNLGSVREGERVIYNGLPWRVKSINFFSTLENPALRGGELRLDLAEMQKLISRPEGPEEPWFPCKEGDWLYFADGIHCKVMFQSPEVVRVRTAGGTMHIWETRQFLSMKPMNFSMGSYGVVFNFALDPRHWDICTSEEVLKKLEAQIRKKFSTYRAGEHLVHILIEFKEPSLDALNYLVRVDMDSGMDDDYYHVKRLANAACIEACYENGWTMPAHQIALREKPEEIPA